MVGERARAVGFGYVLWAVLQVIAALWFASLFARGHPGGAAAVVFWGITLFLSASFAISGRMLMLGDLRARRFAVALAGVAMFQFPIGTVVGFWALRTLTAPELTDEAWARG